MLSRHGVYSARSMMTWKHTATASWTEPLTFAIEYLPNGLWRLFCYRTQMDSLHNSRDAAMAEARAIAQRLAR